MVLQFPHFDPRVKPPLGTQLDRSDPINRGLVGYWLMNEGAGNRVNDLSGNGNAGTFVNHTTWAPGCDGPSLSFDGTDDTVNCGTGQSLNITGDISLCVRFNISTLANGSYELLCHGLAIATGYYLRVDGYGDKLALVTNIPTYTVTSSVNNSVTVGTWHTAVVTIRNGVSAFYIDGIDRSSAATAAGSPVASPTEVLWIGSYRNSSYRFPGKISWAMVYNRALTPSESARLSRDPFCTLRRPEGRAWLGAMSSGGTNHALGGSVAAAASLSATLSIARPLSGSANAIAIPTGGIAIARSAAGSAAGQSSLSGSLGVARTLVGQIAAQPQVAAASLSRTIALSGRVEAATSLLAAGSIVRSLSGGIDATASLTASTEIARSLSGSIAASASLSGSLLTPGGGSVTAIFLMLKKRR